ncbi:MAG: DUF362 domain-containing protein [Syntrophales bacterium]
MAESIITRRDFLRVAAGTAAVTLAGALPGADASAEATATVVLVRHAEAVGSDGRIRGPIVQAMLDEAVGSLFGTDPREAWRRLVARSNVVGIKTNAWYRLPTPPEVEEAIKRRVSEAGVAERNIGIDDRGVLGNPLFLNATALINVRPLRTHHWAGVGTCLKNYIMFVPNPSDYHADGCSPLGKIWTYPVVKGKTRLNVLVALTPQFYGRGANFFDRRYVWPYGGLIVGTDPVAVDTIGAHLLQTKRVAFFGEDRALDVPPVHIIVADKTYHLGVSDRSRIRLIKAGWPEGALI